MASRITACSCRAWYTSVFHRWKQKSPTCANFFDIRLAKDDIPLRMASSARLIFHRDSPSPSPVGLRLRSLNCVPHPKSALSSGSLISFRSVVLMWPELGWTNCRNLPRWQKHCAGALTSTGFPFCVCKSICIFRLMDLVLQKACPIVGLYFQTAVSRIPGIGKAACTVGLCRMCGRLNFSTHCDVKTDKTSSIFGCPNELLMRDRGIMSCTLSLTTPLTCALYATCIHSGSPIWRQCAICKTCRSDSKLV